MTATVTEWHQYNRLVDDTPECGPVCESPWADVPVLRARRADAITTAEALARLVAGAGVPFSVDPEALLADVAACAIRPRGWMAVSA